eukprot:TRINITY_DN39550_c0_g2_i1.p1 TRINITY_DN39550_c0_g2~~TRINITY_DN39550_c0_g2_i1.p1  ORF type:complete len:937 (-),score=114.05 TRINITY_DN39550_c0_g2_i1:615-3425(-)
MTSPVRSFNVLDGEQTVSDILLCFQSELAQLELDLAVGHAKLLQRLQDQLQGAGPRPARDASMLPAGLHIGARVELCKLEDDKQRNGMQGTIHGWDPEHYRWRVVLDDCTMKAIRPMNLVAVPDPTSQGFSPDSTLRSSLTSILSPAKFLTKAGGVLPGARVVINGLKDCPGMNGSPGRVLCFNEDLRRWQVRLDDGSGKLVKTDNLRCVSPGTRVIIVDHVEQPQLNSATGTAQQFDAETEKWEVLLDSGRLLQFKAGNLDFASVASQTAASLGDVDVKLAGAGGTSSTVTSQHSHAVQPIKSADLWRNGVQAASAFAPIGGFKQSNTTSDIMALAPGVRVRVVNARSKPEMNGLTGVVSEYDNGFWKVQMVDGSRKRIGPENLQVLSPLVFGMKAVVRGLTSRPELNGQAGLIVEVEGTEWVKLRLADGSKKKMKALNIFPLDEVSLLDSAEGEFSGTAPQLAANGPQVTLPTAPLQPEVETVIRRLPVGLPRVCILGGTSFQDPASEELVRVLAQAFGSHLVHRVAVLTGGMRGVQEIFAKSLGAGFAKTLLNLLPIGECSNYGVGEDIEAGNDLPERMHIYGQVGQIYISVEGGPGVAKEAAAAYKRGAVLIPLARTGGASSGMFDFPAAALQKPAWAASEHWQCLLDKTKAADKCAVAVVELVKSALIVRAGSGSAEEPQGTTSQCRGTAESLCASPPQQGTSQSRAPEPQIPQMSIKPDPATLRFREEANRIAARLPEGLLRICILGGTEFKNPTSETLVKAITRAFGMHLADSVVLLTGGMPGVQEAFVKGLGPGFTNMFHLLPAGKSSGFNAGTDLEAGQTLEHRMGIYGQIGDVYLAIEGGPGVAKEARAAYERGAVVLPMISTGGASAGMFDFPAGALQRPHHAEENDWICISQPSPVEATAEAVVEIIRSLPLDVSPRSLQRGQP